MSGKFLKKLRITISLFFIAGITTLFLDIWFIAPTNLFSAFTYFQFIPSFLKFISIFSLSSAGFLFVLLITILWGRIYCSSICPLGTFQDLISYFSRKIKIKKRFAFELPFNKTRYIILAITIIIFLLGSITLIDLFDPFSNYGRIVTNFFKPVFISFNNILAFNFEKFGSYLIYPVIFNKITLLIFITVAILLLTVFVLSFFEGRLFCNTLCPLGTLLGLISRFSFYKIFINEYFCNSCGVCELICKSNCIKAETNEIDFSRCVMCFNCLKVCPTNAVELNILKNKQQRIINTKKSSRRKFINTITTGFFGIANFGLLIPNINVNNKAVKPAKSKLPVLPPGSLSYNNFTSKCTSCHLCISACPTQVLTPSFLDFGLEGILMPKMNYSANYCNHECNRCSEVCPAGAILPIEATKKKLTQIGKVKFIKENCIVITNKTECGACSEHCPTKAVEMKPYEKLMLPEVDDEICIGCGACEYACPTKPYKAIYVESNSVHQLAKKPKSKKSKEDFKLQDDFPF